MRILIVHESHTYCAYLILQTIQGSHTKFPKGCGWFLHARGTEITYLLTWVIVFLSNLFSS